MMEGLPRCTNPPITLRGRGRFSTAAFLGLALAFSLLWPADAAVAAYPADPAADGKPAFCAPVEPVRDFGLSALPPIKEVPESGEALGHGAVSIYGGRERVMTRRPVFGYGFSEHNYTGRVRLNWTITAELWAVDANGVEIERVDRARLFIRHLNAAHQPHIEVRPPKGRLGFYRFDMRITERPGRDLGTYGAYFTVVKPYSNVKLGVADDTARPGERVFSRLENFGSEVVEYGEAFGIQRFDGGHWIRQPDLLPEGWLLWGGILRPGDTGLCNSIRLPEETRPGRYRFVKAVYPQGLGKKAAFRTALFTVKG